MYTVRVRETWHLITQEIKCFFGVAISNEFDENFNKIIKISWKFESIKIASNFINENL